MSKRHSAVVLAVFAVALVGGCEQGYMARYDVRLSRAATRLKVNVHEARSKILDLVDRFAQAQGLTRAEVEKSNHKPIMISRYHKSLPEGPGISIYVFEGDQPDTLWVEVTEVWSRSPLPETQRVDRELGRTLEEAVGKDAVTRVEL